MKTVDVMILIALISAGIIFLAVRGIVFWFSRRRRHGGHHGSHRPHLMRPYQRPKENMYYGLRNLALSATPAQLGLTMPSDETKVFGLVMDWGYEGAVVTVVSFVTGDASLYLSSGAVIIGGITHKSVSESAKKLIDFSQQYLAKAEKTKETPIPPFNKIYFYFLTNNGIFKAQTEMKSIEDETSELHGLFSECNDVITEIRLLEERGFFKSPKGKKVMGDESPAKFGN